MNKLIEKIRENKYKNLFWSLIYRLSLFITISLLKIIPQKMYVKFRFKKSFNKKLDLKNPQSFTEKIQWKKLYDHNPLYTKLADKYEVRNYIKYKIGEKHLIPLLYHTDKPETIPFDKLPLPCIIKSNHWSGHVIIIKERKEINKEEIIRECETWLNMNYYDVGKEWQYKNIKPQILVEKLLLDEKDEIPKDYKFHCFDGKVEFIWVCSDRFGNSKSGSFDKNWKRLPFIITEVIDGKNKYGRIAKVPRPQNLNQMIKIAEELSKNFDYIRVDLYSLNNKIYFGELTFHPGGGFSHFIPERYNLIYGEKLKLRKFKNKK